MKVIPFARRARCKHKPNYRARRRVSGQRRVDGGGIDCLRSVVNMRAKRNMIYGWGAA